MPEWVTKIAQAILDNWTVGTYSNFCDEVDFDGATVEEVAELIWREYQTNQLQSVCTCFDGTPYKPNLIQICDQCGKLPRR